jgi:hypothetical protein
VFLLITAFVNPFRETPIDDDCAYAWTVRHLLDTGEYRPHNWMTVNMPFQAYWGAAFAAWMPGFFGALRFSTLPLSLAGLCAFYYLALECRLDRWVAFLLTEVLFSSYLYFWGSFSFMSDVPALAWSLLALLCWAVALRKQSLVLACLGAAAAGAAVLTRQSSVALPMGLVTAAVLDRQRLKRWPLYLVGVAVPLAALAYGASLPSSFAAREYDDQLRAYWTNIGQILVEGFWRTSELLIGAAVLILPLAAAFMLWKCCRAIATIRQRRASAGAIAAIVFGLAAVGFTCFYSATAKGGTVLLPHLLWWYDGYYGGLLQQHDGAVNVAVSVLALLAAAALWPMLLSHANPWRARPLLPAGWLLEAHALCYVGLLLIFVKLLDRYTAPLLPVLLLLMGRAALPLWRRRWVGLGLAGCVVAVLAVHAFQAGGRLRFQEATWRGSRLALEAGIPANRIKGSDEWIVYHAFDDFVVWYQRSGLDGDFFTAYFGMWLPRYLQEAQADVRDGSADRGDWKVLAEIPYRDALGESRRVVVLVRPDRLDLLQGK